MLDNETLELIEQEVTVSFTEEELKAFSNFEDFFSEVDTQNAFEEEWNPETYRPLYLFVFKKLRGAVA